MSTGKNLIFLISQPRAGSTLLQKILAGHPEIHTLSEPWIALHPLFALRSRGTSANYAHALARSATVEFLEALPAGQDTYYEGVRLMLNHLYTAALGTSGKSIFLDKTPRYYFIVPELRRVFPDARFIFLIRNPLAVFSSIFEAWVTKPHFGERYAFRADLVHDLLTAPDALAQAIASPDPNCAVIHYENLALSPASNIARLCQQLRLPFHPEMIEYGKQSDVHWSFGDQGTVYAEQHPVSSRVERWQTVLRSSAPLNELARSYLAALGPRLTGQLGYSYDGLAASLGMLSSQDQAPDFLQTAVLTPFYQETCDYLSQFTSFKDLIDQATRAVGSVPVAAVK